MGYSSYKGECIKPVRDTAEFDAAREDCARSGAILDVGKTRAHYDFLKAVGTRLSERERDCMRLFSLCLHAFAFAL